MGTLQAGNCFNNVKCEGELLTDGDDGKKKFTLFLEEYANYKWQIRDYGWGVTLEEKGNRKMGSSHGYKMKNNTLQST